MDDFQKSRGEILLRVRDLDIFDYNVKGEVGILVSEKLDFGSGKKINSLFFDLLKITPMSKDEVRKYDELLRDRNLLVHNGGFYTVQLAKDKFKNEFTRDKILSEYVKVTNKDFEMWLLFLMRIVYKMTISTSDGLKSFVENNDIVLEKDKEEALNELIKDIDYIRIDSE